MAAGGVNLVPEVITHGKSPEVSPPEMQRLESTHGVPLGTGVRRIPGPVLPH